MTISNISVTAVLVHMVISMCHITAVRAILISGESNINKPMLRITTTKPNSYENVN